MSHLIDDKFVTPCSTTIVARHFQSIKEDVAMYRRHTAPYRQLNESCSQFKIRESRTESKHVVTDKLNMDLIPQWKPLLPFQSERPSLCCVKCIMVNCGEFSHQNIKI